MGMIENRKMKPEEAHSLARIKDVFAQMGIAEHEIDILQQPAGGRADFLVKVRGMSFVIESKGRGDAAAAARAVHQLGRYRREVESTSIPVVVVPFMGEVGKSLCREAGVYWIDLSGNVHIKAPGFFFHVEGKTNLFTRRKRGRPANIFAPKSSRITRWLLMHPDTAFSQRKLATSAELDEGFTSRIINGLQAEGYIEKDDDGKIQVKSPDRLLDAWARGNQKSHILIEGRISSGTSSERVQDIIARIKTRDLQYAVTGLSTVDLLQESFDHDPTSICLQKKPSKRWISELGIKLGSDSPNIWLIIPNDEGIFHGSFEQDGIHSVHPVQAFIDLQWHFHEGQAAAELIRQKHLPWSKHGE